MERTGGSGMAPRKNPISYDQACYELLCEVPRGKVTTYAELAKAVSRKFGFRAGAARAVGNAMNRNPNAPKVPCHRVVRSNGELGGYAGGPTKKRTLLTTEGVEVSGARVKDLPSHLFQFTSRR
jgi:methylated-DNA-[protein]-cysteine S-methyltransferase